jgi:hypothetical protein
MNKYIFKKKEFNKVWDYLSKNLFYEPNIQDLLLQCESQGNIILVGGAIKDIAFFNKIPKDFDFIVKCENKVCLTLSSKFLVNKNSFGNYKIRYNNLIFDIWNCKNEHELFNSSIRFNTDGLYINLSTGTYNARLYNQSINEGIVRTINNKSIHPDKERDYDRGRIIAEKLGLKYQYSL